MLVSFGMIYFMIAKLINLYHYHLIDIVSRMNIEQVVEYQFLLIIPQHPRRNGAGYGTS